MQLDSKNFLVIITLLFCIGEYSSCKKGKEDPLISFRSRKARLVGTWKVAEFNSLYIKGKGTGADSCTTLISGAIYQSGCDTTKVDSVLFNYSFKKDGTYKKREYYLFKNKDTELIETEGTWNFLDGIGKDKNKESILLTNSTVYYTLLVGGRTLTYFENSTFLDYTTYHLLRLSNKELIMDFERNSGNASGKEERIKGSYTLVPTAN